MLIEESVALNALKLNKSKLIVLDIDKVNTDCV